MQDAEFMMILNLKVGIINYGSLHLFDSQSKILVRAAIYIFSMDPKLFENIKVWNSKTGIDQN